MSRINTLDPIVAARIAAGEVIDRPQAIARELIDNAIDAGADDITLTIEGGGITLLSVADNGEGIEKEDLPLTVQRHATSKIKTLEDLYHIRSLGFRGEALYSISAVSKLTIASRRKDKDAYTFIVDNGKESEVIKGGPDRGTIITSENLFEEIPARRSFLKRESSEAGLCRSMLLSKAMAFPEVHFRFMQDGALRIDLPKRDNLYERTLDILTLDERLNRKSFVKLEEKGELFSLCLITSMPEVHRSDRSRMKIYVNGRQVEEYSLIQAITYGYGEKLPGGAYPYSVLFLEDDPEMVDFNIHPAKKEVKLRNRAEIHHTISELIKRALPSSIPTIKAKEETPDLPIAKTVTSYQNNEYLLRRYDNYQMRGDEVASRTPTYYREEAKPKDNSWLLKAKELSNKKIEEIFVPSAAPKEELWNREDESFTYLGQAFRLFLICERKGKLYLVDQHAAHERVIFNELREQKSVQRLLVPIEFEVDPDIDTFLTEHGEVYTQFGINLARKEDKLWEISSLPAMARPVEKELVAFISTQMASESEIETGLYAIVACKAAIKAGDEVDRYSAEALLEKVFELEDPACPHGRTFIITLEESELRKMVGRTK